MDIRMKATLTEGLLKHHLALVKEEPKVLRWYYSDMKTAFMEESFANQELAISRLRWFVDTFDDWSGWDLTIEPVAPPPEERAADAINQLMRKLHVPTIHAEDIADIISSETNIGPLVDAVEKMVAHFFQVLGNTDPLAAGLMHGVVVELEKTKQVDLSALKKVLSSPPKPRVDTTSRIIIPKVGRA